MRSAKALSTSKGLTIHEDDGNQFVTLDACARNLIQGGLHIACALVRNHRGAFFSHLVSHEHVHIGGAVQSFGIISVHTSRRINHSGNDGTGKAIHQCVHHLAVCFLIFGSNVLPVKFDAVATVFRNPAAYVRNEGREGFVGGSDSLQVTFGFHATNGNDQLNVVVLGKLGQSLEVFSVIFVCEGQGAVFCREETHIVDIGHGIITDVLRIELRILAPVRIEANNLVRGCLGHSHAGDNDSRCKKFEIHIHPTFYSSPSAGVVTGAAITGHSSEATQSMQ